MDTGNDPRLLVAERALNDLKTSLQQGRLKAQFPRREAAEACQRGAAALLQLKYSYAAPDALRDMPQYRELQESVDAVEAHLGGPDWRDRIKEDALAVAQAHWALRTVRSVGARLDLPGQGFETGVDAVVGRVVSATPHPAADSLLVTRVAAGEPLRVVTNDTTVKADDEVGVALLPPSDLRGVVSEGMFLGAGKGVLKGVAAHEATGRPDVPDAAWSETRSLVGQYTEGK